MQKTRAVGKVGKSRKKSEKLPSGRKVGKFFKVRPTEVGGVVRTFATIGFLRGFFPTFFRPFGYLQFMIAFRFIRLAWAGFQAEKDDKIAGA